ncbi:hypothetical protein [Rhodococcus sp. NPDC127528]|uniref:hypothetical protein n=1 Tax=unclassified Rhodococcus (in: high G+C Gram-positive bacteria) TaxID=192944 RepID=UPI0036327BD3
MARLGPRRVQVAIRLTDEQVESLDRQATAEGLLTKSGEPNRSELVRILLEYARENMPANWRPEGYDRERGVRN